MTELLILNLIGTFIFGGNNQSRLSKKLTFRSAHPLPSTEVLVVNVPPVPSALPLASAGVTLMESVAWR